MRRPVPLPTSAQFSFVLRVRIDHRPGMLGRVATAIGEAGGTIGSIDLVAIDDAHTLRDMTVDAAGTDHVRRDRRRRRRGRRRRGDRHHRPHVPDARRRQDRAAQQASAAHPRRPLDGLHARRGARLQRDRAGPRQGLPVHDQAQHGRGRLRRQRRPRARGHRTRGGDAGHGGEGDAVQGVRRRRRVPALPRHEGPGRDRGDRDGRSRPPSAASTSRTSARRAASRSRSA